MNNKGFAITSVIYGLSILGMLIVLILMGTISASRRNVVEQAEHVEEFLINLNKATGVYSSTGNFTVPEGESGWYRVEVFGKNVPGTNSARGAYATGIIYAVENTVYDISIGSEYSIFSLNGTNLISAGAGVYYTPNYYSGGGLKCYLKEPPGASIEEGQQLTAGTTLNGLTESDITGVGASTCHGSYIRGYPGADTSLDTDISQYVVDGLILPAASGVDNGRVIIYRLAGAEENGGQYKVKNAKFSGNANTISVSTPVGVSVNRIYYSYHDDTKGYVRSCAAGATSCSPGRIIDAVNVFFNTNSTATLKNVQVKINGSDIYNGSSYGTPAGVNGLHISAYQPDSTDTAFASHGNYYIIPVDLDNRVVVAPTSVNDPLGVGYITGETSQKWSMDYLDNNFPYVSTGTTGYQKEYRIMELSKYKAMNIALNENYELNTISASETFNSLTRTPSQIWRIRSTGDRAFAIKTVVVPSTYAYIDKRSGFLFANPIDGRILVGRANNPANDPYDPNENNANPTMVERFYLYSLNYG